MENKSHALMAGLFTLLLLAAAITIGMWLYRDQVNWVPYEIATRQSIPGLNPQADVRYRGLDVGRVESIGFDPKEAGQILVRINVRPDTPITRSTFATLGYQGVTGLAYVQLDDDGSQPARLPSSPEDPARIAMRPSLFDQLQHRGLGIMEQTEEVARRLNTLLADENQQAILAAFESVGRAAREIEAIPRQMQPTLARLPALTRQAQQTLGTLDAIAVEARQLTGNLDGLITELRAKDGAIATIAGSVEQVGAVAAKLEHETLPLANDMRSALRALNRTLNNLSDRPQSVFFGAPDVAPGPGEPGFAAPGR
jgi:phospholipid/cholesterol/gamma-HCH transport system substrate-binding protein